MLQVDLCRRPTSTKTRIETSELFNYWTNDIEVADQHPLKQGLKRRCESRQGAEDVGVADQHPLKQGLKQDSGEFNPFWMDVADQHPLKQGLKRNNIRLSGRKYTVADQHPLKQGLKQMYGALCGSLGDMSQTNIH